jgi:hypothetical protein
MASVSFVEHLMLHPKVLIPMWMVFAIPAISRRIALE